MVLKGFIVFGWPQKPMKNKKSCGVVPSETKKSCGVEPFEKNRRFNIIKKAF